MAHELKRTTFETSRLLQFFNKRELEAQTGQHSSDFPEMIAKELVDNSIDGCEASGTPPQITVTITNDSITVADNGPGIPVATIKSALDYMKQVSDKAKYISPTRGSKGYGLKCVFAVPYVVSGNKEGRINVSTNGQGFEIVVRTDQILQETRIELQNSRAPLTKTGTCVRVHWPPDARTKLENCRFMHLVTGFAFLNPHISIKLTEPNVSVDFQPTDPGWEKWLPKYHTSAHWYTPEEFAGQVAAHIAAGEDWPVRDLITDFKGLTGSIKPPAILESVGLDRSQLSDLVSDGEMKMDLIKKLLTVMQKESPTIKAKKLGVIGENNLRTRFTELGCNMATFRYAKKLSDSPSTPFVVEAAFAAKSSKSKNRKIITGINWSPGIKDAFTYIEEDRALDALLQERHCDRDEPIILLLHITTPKPSWLDNGKSRIYLVGEAAEAFVEALSFVTAEWNKVRRSENRDGRSRRDELGIKSTRVAQRNAAWDIMAEAYAKASGHGAHPASSTQIMYAARPVIQQRTGKLVNRQYFNQSILPDFITANPELTANWRVTYDPRGHFTEPHTEREIELGTSGVAEYLDTIDVWHPNWIKSVRLTTGDLPSALETFGPQHRFSGILFIEKEGYVPLMRAFKMCERYDLAMMSTKGVSSTAARRLVDGLAGYAAKTMNTPLPLLVLHDFDKSGFTILGIFNRATRRYAYENKLLVIDLGLRLDEATTMGLQTENVIVTGKHPEKNLKANGATRKEINFLLSGRAQRTKRGVPGQRVELNAMTSDQMVPWLERKIREAGIEKVIPPNEVIEAGYRQLLAQKKLHGVIKAAIPGIERQVQRLPLPSGLVKNVKARLKANPELPWDAALAAEAYEANL